MFSGVLPGISMSPDRQWLRSYPDRGRPVHLQRRRLMRRASTCLALLGLAVLGLPAVAAAEEIPTPKITVFKAKAIPIPKPGGGSYPETGNILAAGADVEDA